jgi:hypothetical protein
MAARPGRARQTQRLGGSRPHRHRCADPEVHYALTHRVRLSVRAPRYRGHAHPQVVFDASSFNHRATLGRPRSRYERRCYCPGATVVCHARRENGRARVRAWTDQGGGFVLFTQRYPMGPIQYGSKCLGSRATAASGTRSWFRPDGSSRTFITQKVGTLAETVTDAVSAPLV